jgi:hypothetical protein
MGKVIPFPDPEERAERDNIQVTGGGISLYFDECTKLVHYFDTVPGRCKCGQKFWNPPNDPEERDVPA